MTKAKLASKILYSVVLTALCAVALLLIISRFPIKGNIQVKMVLSGSMEPAIKIGSVVIVKPEAEYKIGDIITFGEDSKNSTPTTHRITNSRVLEGKLYFKTKGDVNNSEDTTEVSEDKVIGKVLFDIPYLGYVISFAKKPIGFTVIIGIPAIMVIWDEVVKIIAETKKLKAKKLAKNENQAENNKGDEKE